MAHAETKTFTSIDVEDERAAATVVLEESEAVTDETDGGKDEVAHFALHFV